jgi:predicted RNA binding protein YcfA (HicA-like mRNA interferase family)
LVDVGVAAVLVNFSYACYSPWWESPHGRVYCVPRLKCTFREFIEIILAHKFWLERQESSHRQYKDAAGNRVTVAAHDLGDEIKPGTLNTMIRQSGLPKSLFRK